MQKGERQTKRMMWFRGQQVPILSSTRRKDIFGSEDWIARGTIQRIGAIIFATIFFCGSAAFLSPAPYSGMKLLKRLVAFWVGSLEPG
ncbi:MAG: hypothetical protein WCB11_22845 [Terriglobales bacterium]